MTRKFEIGEGLTLADVFDKDNIEIYKRSKDFHLKEISKKTGVPLEVRPSFAQQSIFYIRSKHFSVRYFFLAHALRLKSPVLWML